MPHGNTASAVIAEADTAGADRPNGVGPRIKAFRTARRVSLRQLADMTGTTASFISQLERNLCGASSGTLIRIAAALDLGIKDLFDESDGPLHKVLKRDERPALPVSEGCRKTLLSRRPIHEFEVYAGHFEVGGSTGARAYTHGGRHEMFVVQRGTVELTLADETFILREGDSIEYATSTPHRTVNVGDTPAEVLWIIAPPTSGRVELDKYITRKSLASG